MEVSSGNWSDLGNFPNSKKLKITLKNLLWFSKNFSDIPGKMQTKRKVSYTPLNPRVDTD